MREVEGLRAALTALAAVPLDRLDDAALGGELVELFALAGQLDGAISARLAAFDGHGGASADGAVSTASWLRSACLLGPGEARQRVLVARALDRTLTATGAALDAGDIAYRHAALITRAVEDLPGEVIPGMEAALLRAARLCDPARLGREVTRLRHAIAPQLAAGDAEAAFDRRALYAASTFGGTVDVAGTLPGDGGATVLTALHAYSAPTPGDTRSPAQRRADALVEICSRALQSATPPESGGERPHLSVVVDLAELLGRPGAAPAELGWTGPLTTPALLRLACDASIVRVLTAGESEILDVGRRTRVVPAALRRAVALRDRGCVFPGCDRPPQWCDAHHLLHWAHGGPTTLANLALLCGHHHHLVHDSGWQISRDHHRRWHATKPDPTHQPAQPAATSRAGPRAA